MFGITLEGRIRACAGLDKTDAIVTRESLREAFDLGVGGVMTIDIGGEAGRAVLRAFSRPDDRSGDDVLWRGEEILRLLVGGGVRGECGGV